VDEIDLELESLSVLVGLNGSGKSNIIDILRFIRDAIAINLERAILDRNGLSAIRRWSGGQDIQLGLSIVFHNWSGMYTFSLGGDSERGYRVKRERFRFVGENGSEVVYEIRNGAFVDLPYDIRNRIPGSLPELPRSDLVIPRFMAIFDRNASVFFDHIFGMSFYSIYPDRIKRPQAASYPYPVEENGMNLAYFLRQTKEDTSHLVESSIIEALSKVVPDISGYTVTQTGGYFSIKLNHELEDGRGRKPTFDLNQESDGTVRILTLLAAIYQEPPRSLLAIEEPELNIHPGAVGVLCDVLQEARLRSQVLITTHSPDLIERFPIESLLIVEKEKGVTRVGQIDEVQRQIVKERLFSAGDLLRIEGLRRAEPVLQ
jgi:predicted ATPase